jgi:hypothetical protein
MIPLSPNLDNIDFDALVELARGLLPSLSRTRSGSPAWDDYNYSDPGITLIELLAFIADTQVYALGRNRGDERVAMAALFDAAPQGAVPALGTLYPLADAAVAYHIDAAARLTPAQAQAPRLEVDHGIDVVPVRLVRMTREIAGAATDLTATNAQARACFTPFGEPPAPDAALRITLEGTLPDTSVQLSLGIEIEGGAAAASPALGTIDAFYGTGREPLRCLLDRSQAMQSSGVMIFKLPAEASRAARQRHDIILRQRAPNLLMPRLLRIAPNALPVVQCARFRYDEIRGNGRAGQVVKIEPQALFGDDEPTGGWTWRLTDSDALQVAVSDGRDLVPWRPLAISVAGRSGRPTDFAECGPADQVFTGQERADGNRIEIRFGNTINGRAPAPDATIAVDLTLSAGDAGNIGSPLEWLLDGQRTRWENRQAIAGGKDAETVKDTLLAVRRALGEARTLATSPQLAAAALVLPSAFGIVRAEVEDGWERGRRRPSIAATRTLIVARRGEATETPAWCEAVARSLRPRVAIGERLLVVAPVYRRFRIAVHATAATGAEPAAVTTAIGRDLIDRLAPTGRRGATWPLGCDVDPAVVGGWIRRIGDVARVDGVTLLDDVGRPLADNRLRLGRGELPQWLADGRDIIVAAGARR